MVAHDLRRPQPPVAILLDPATDVFIFPDRYVRHANILDSFRQEESVAGESSVDSVSPGFLTQEL